MASSWIVCPGAGLVGENVVVPAPDGDVVAFMSSEPGADTITFLDLEDIPGVFREALPRVSLDNLPDEGAWLQPLRPLSALLASR